VGSWGLTHGPWCSGSLDILISGALFSNLNSAEYWIAFLCYFLTSSTLYIHSNTYPRTAGWQALFIFLYIYIYKELVCLFIQEIEDAFLIYIEGEGMKFQGR
jgi:hypothetical protein